MMHKHIKNRVLTDISFSWRCVLSKCDGRLGWFDIEFPKRATIDFEIAIKNAFNSISNNVQIRYRYFH